MTTKQKWRKSPPELINAFQTATSQLKGVTHRKMFGYPCCFCSGNMFTGLHQESWIVRLSEEDREAIGTDVFAPTPGRAMREYRLLSAEVQADPEQLAHWLTRSLDYAQSLPPK